MKPLWFHKKKTNLNFETTLVSQKKTLLKNTNVNRHVGSAKSTYSGQRRRHFGESESVLMLNKGANKSLFSEKYRAKQGTMVCLATFFIVNSLEYIFFSSLQKYTRKQVKFYFLSTIKTPSIDTLL